MMTDKKCPKVIVNMILNNMSILDVDLDKNIKVL